MVDEKKVKLPKGILEKLRGLAKAFEANRDGLLDAAKELISLETGGWTNAERLFEIAKRTDSIRLALRDLVEEPASVAMERKDEQTSESIQPRQVPRQKKRKEDYPKYSIRGDTLVKIGLSRDLKNEYEHFVSKAAFAAVMTRLEVFKKVDEFTADELQEELEIPIYQTYIVVAVLKQLGILGSPRRGVHSFRGNGEVALDVSSIWSRL